MAQKKVSFCRDLGQEIGVSGPFNNLVRCESFVEKICGKVRLGVFGLMNRGCHVEVKQLELRITDHYPLLQDKSIV